MSASTSSTTIERARFGEHDGKTVERFVLTNESGMKVSLISYGAAIQELFVADGDTGKRENVVLGFTTLDGYLGKNPHFGSVLGRYAGRIGNASFPLDGETIHITPNKAPNSAHGGAKPFDKFVWDSAIVDTEDGPGVRFSRTSPDGEEGYPGTLDVHVTYSLTADDGLRLFYEATTDKPTVINLTNHCYFNLTNEESGAVDEQFLQINANRFAIVDEAQIPTGELASVEGDSLDFREPKRLGDVVRDSANPQIVIGRGIDQSFIIDRPTPDDASLIEAAWIEDPITGRVMEVFTTEPTVHVYTANSLDGSVAGYSGALYRQGDAICFETQHLPDSPNHADNPDFPSTVLRPGETFTSTTIYRFSAG